MNRNLHNAMMAQYATPKAVGNGLVSWDKGIKCVMPSVKLFGAAEQGTLTGKNLFKNMFPPSYTSEVFTNGLWGNRVASLEEIDAIRDKIVTYSAFIDNTKGNDKSNVTVWVRNSDGVYVLIKSGTEIAVGAKGTSAVTINFSDYSNINLVNFGASLNGAANKPITISQGMVELGSTATAYEPYCGGIPAPNPSYPIMPVCNDGVFQSTSPDGTWNGGKATAPNLWAIPGTDIRDEWDAQTGRGVRRCGVIKNYAGETITTSYLSSTGELSEGATVIYSIPDTPFVTAPSPLTQPNVFGQIIQISGSVPDCPIEAAYLTHS